jgi:hypothetical protein
MANIANLIATYQSNPTLQGRYTQQEYLDMFGFGAQQPTPTPDPDPTPIPPPSDGIQNIIGQNLNQGGGGGGGIMGLQQTFTPGAQPRGPKFDPNINPAFTLTGKGRLDPMGSDIDYFNSLRAQNDPRAFTSGLSIDNVGSDSRYFEEPSMINKGITAVKDFFSGIGTPKVRGTLGTRLANQPRLPLPGAIMAYSRSPLNPASGQFNPAFEGQLNYLEGQDGFIGRDQQSGGLKYGPESVLSGQNVISAFGTNDYLGQLNKYEDKVTARYDKLVDKFGEESDEATKYYDKFVQKVLNEKKKFTDSTIYKAQKKKEEEQRKQKEKERMEASAANRAEAAAITARLDREFRDASGGGFDVSGPDTSANPTGRSNRASQERGFALHGAKGGSVPTGLSKIKYNDGGRVYLYNRLK